MSRLSSILRKKPVWKRVLYVVFIVALLPILGLFGLSVMSEKPENLGVTDGQLAKCPDTPNCVSSQSDSPDHQMPPLKYDGTRENTIAKLKSALKSLPRVKVVEEHENYLRAEATSRFFGFVDDVEFFLDDAEKVVHFRSASRVGRSDLGVNRKRMEELRKLFEK